MARRMDSGQHVEWRKRLERFLRSGVTVPQFCDGERVSVASFYYWRKKLGQTASRRRTRSRPGVFRQVAVIPAPPAMAPAAPAVAQDTPAVVPAPPAIAPAPPAMAPAAPAVAQDTPAVVPAPPAIAPAAPAVAQDTPAVVPGPPAVIPAPRAVVPAVSAGVPASSRIVIQLPCGTRIDVDAEHLDAVRAVVAEVARVDRSTEAARVGGGAQRTADGRGREAGIASC